MHVLDNGVCVTCRPVTARAEEHVLVDGLCTTCTRIVARFDPKQIRDPHTGEWIDTTPGDSGHGGILGRLAKALTKQDALDAAPAKLKRASGGHHGDYAGEGLSGPRGMGSVRALSEYEGVEYLATNSALRRRDLSDSKDAERIAEIDKTMSVSRLQSDVRVDRAIKEGRHVFGEQAWWNDGMNSDDFDEQDAGLERWKAGERPDLTGLRWKELGYSSTTADPAVAKDFGKRWPGANDDWDGEPVIMTILAPKGTGGVQLAEMGHAAEILLQRDLTFEIAADHGVGPDGFRLLDVVVVPDGQ